VKHPIKGGQALGLALVQQRPCPGADTGIGCQLGAHGADIGQRDTGNGAAIQRTTLEQGFGQPISDKTTASRNQYMHILLFILMPFGALRRL
jgi:hypothetical protein